ncbi:MAG: acetyl-CoA hydrolase [Acidobacteria bacterium]|nr:MAG: acetyl-CoA hydrolase [Acidobacteriota bacterium]
MQYIQKIGEAVNSSVLKPGTKLYIQGNAATPQKLIQQLIDDNSISGIEVLSVLLLGEISGLFSESTCKRITHRVIFSGPHSRAALNSGLAKYQLMHLSDIPRQVKKHLNPNAVFLSVSGPDNGGNFSLGTTVEGVYAAIQTAKRQGGVIIAERNIRMPFVLGTTIPGDMIDYLIDVDYPMPASPVQKPDERAKKIGQIIAERYIVDGATLQYGIGEVPEAVTEAILTKGTKDLGIFTELFACAMRSLVEKGVVTNKYMKNNFSIGSIFLAGDQEGYDWLDFNSSVQSRPCDYTNNIINLAMIPKMTSINSAIGVDLHGNVWADSLFARKVYSGVGGQADFIRGAYLSEGGTPIIAMKSSTKKGKSKIMDKCPEGITTTAIAADPVVIVTEHGAFDPRGLSIGEHAVGIAHLAEPDAREDLLRHIYDSVKFHRPKEALKDGCVKGFQSYEQIVGKNG